MGTDKPAWTELAKMTLNESQEIKCTHYFHIHKVKNIKLINDEKTPVSSGRDPGSGWEGLLGSLRMFFSWSRQ